MGNIGGVVCEQLLIPANLGIGSFNPTLWTPPSSESDDMSSGKSSINSSSPSSSVSKATADCASTY